MIFALSDATTVTIAVGGLVVLLAVLAALRVLLRREPSPPSWRRYRMGVFLERDPSENRPTIHDEREVQERRAKD